MAKDLVPIIEQVMEKAAETKVKIADNGGWDRGDFRDIYVAIVEMVAIIEAAADEMGGLTEEEKKQVLSETLNWLIDLPWMTEKMEGMLLDLVVGMVWEFAMEKLHR